MPAAKDPFNSKATLKTKSGTYTYHDLNALTRQKIGHVQKLPYSMRVLLEAMLRNVDGFVVTADDVAAWPTGTRKAPAQGRRCRSCPAAWCCRTSPACRAWSTSRRCAMR